MAHPFAVDLFQELPGGGTPGIHGGEDEDHEIGDGHEALGDELVLVFHGVGAGGIDDVEIAQEIDGGIHFIQRRRYGHDVVLIAMAEEEDLAGGGYDTGAGEILAKEGIEEGGFAHIHLAHDDEDKGLFEAGDEIVQDHRGIRIAIGLAQRSGESQQVRADA